MSPAELMELSPKQLRTLRNNLNNRLASFKQDGVPAKPLQKSHRLFALNPGECQALSEQVFQEMKRRSRE